MPPLFRDGFTASFFFRKPAFTSAASVAGRDSNRCQAVSRSGIFEA
jgi:hypothetical protein